jgi:hypothetical protein
MKGGEIKIKYAMVEEGRKMECKITVGFKDGSGYPLSVCPQVKNLLGMDLGTSLDPLVWVWVAFGIHGYLQNG